MKYKVGVVGFAALFASFFAFCGCKENCAKKIFFAGATQNAKVSPKADGAISDKFIFPAEGAVKFDGMLGKSLDTAMNGDILVWNTDELLARTGNATKKSPPTGSRNSRANGSTARSLRTPTRPRQSSIKS